jgi:hypothetical protein
VGCSHPRQDPIVLHQRASADTAGKDNHIGGWDVLEGEAVVGSDVADLMPNEDDLGVRQPLQDWLSLSRV